MYPIEHMLAWKTELGHPFRKRQVSNRSSKVHDPIHFLSMFKALYNKGNVYKFQIFFVHWWVLADVSKIQVTFFSIVLPKWTFPGAYRLV